MVNEKTKHGIKFETCECGSLFMDIINKDKITSTANTLIEIHKKYGHLNYFSPVNYLFFTISPNNSYINLEEVHRIFTLYPGRSDKGILRSMAQLANLFKNHNKSVGRDEKLSKIYENTILNGNGIYLMLLMDEAVTDINSLQDNVNLAKTFEFASKYLDFK